MSRSNPPPPSQNPRGNNAPIPPSLSIQEALSKINRERLAEFANNQLPSRAPQPSNPIVPPYAFVNPRDVEKMDVSQLWRAGEIKAEQNGDFLRQSREMRKQKEKEKEAKDKEKTENAPKKKEHAGVEKDVEVEEAVQADDNDRDGGLHPEPASPKPSKNKVNEWKYMKVIEAGLPPRRSSTYRRDTDSNGN